jgi:PAS domain S-box-containing protein
MMSYHSVVDDLDIYRKAFYSDSIAKAVINRKGQWVRINNALCRLTGYEKDELESIRFEDVFSKQILSFILEQHEETINIETAFRRTNGDIIWLMLLVSPILQNHEVDVDYVIQFMDITGSKQNEREYNHLHQLNQLVLDSVAEGIYGIDLNANVIFWNRAAEKMTGFHYDDFSSANWLELIHHTNKQGEKIRYNECLVYQALNNGESMFVTDDIFWCKDGTNFPVDYSINPIYEKSIYVGTVITFTDITEKRKTNELILKSEKLSIAGQLAAGLAHEIRNPLTSLKGFLQVIHASPEKMKVYYNIMGDELSRIETILSELLMLAKPQAIQFQYKDVCEILRQVVLLLSPQALLQNIEIEMQTADRACFINCDENQLKQVFINVIKNAIDSMELGGSIRIHTEMGEQMISIHIIDQGCGIPENKIKQIGEPFYTTKEKGTGLGLMVTYKIVEHHQGRIDIESRIGEGTRFTLKFPCKCM